MRIHVDAALMRFAYGQHIRNSLEQAQLYESASRAPNRINDSDSNGAPLYASKVWCL